jgi:hypothetical protein
MTTLKLCSLKLKPFLFERLIWDTMLAAALLAAVAVALPVDERTLTANLLQLLSSSA